MSGEMMRAAVPDGDGGISLQQVPVPRPETGEVLVRVAAAGMNRADLLHARGKYGQRAFVHPTRPNVAGMEMAGRVMGLGSDVTEVVEGDVVMALCAGGYADYVAVDQRLLIAVPPGLDAVSAAALPMALLTEYEALIRLAGLRPGERVLVVGATSGVGLAGVQLARHLGAGHVVATSRSSASAELLQRLGADAVAASLGDLAALAGSQGYDVVLDHVGGEWFESMVPHLAKGARVVSVGRLGARAVSLDLATMASRRVILIGTTWKTQELAEITETVAGVRDQVLPAVEDGRVVPVVADTVELDRIEQGYRRLQQEHSPGKLVVVTGCE